jgi:hypothetical protein
MNKKEKLSLYIINIYSSLSITIFFSYFISLIYYRKGDLIGSIATKYLSVAVLIPYILAIPTIYALKIDMEYVDSKSDWNPGRGYFAMCIPHPLLMAISLIYIYRRHKNAPRTDLI